VRRAVRLSLLALLALAVPLGAAPTPIRCGIRFGKLTMSDTDMQLIDADPATPFDFFPARYEAQLVAGYPRNTRRKGLQVFTPDYSRVATNGGMLDRPKPR